MKIYSPIKFSVFIYRSTTTRSWTAFNHFKQVLIKPVSSVFRLEFISCWCLKQALIAYNSEVMNQLNKNTNTPQQLRFKRSWLGKVGSLIYYDQRPYINEIYISPQNQVHTFYCFLAKEKDEKREKSNEHSGEALFFIYCREMGYFIYISRKRDDLGCPIIGNRSKFYQTAIDKMVLLESILLGFVLCDFIKVQAHIEYMRVRVFQSMLHHSTVKVLLRHDQCSILHTVLTVLYLTVLPI